MISLRIRSERRSKVCLRTLPRVSVKSRSTSIGMSHGFLRKPSGDHSVSSFTPFEIPHLDDELDEATPVVWANAFAFH